ncbi:ComEA family DNA-binding protein [Ascidiimonas aurantiaca]|uniref:ComEA family DNA-binding protein n=1 Tax=Ascidiimonas aurantiaca TaxID=1685432 RepID=UPI0030EE81FA
MKIGSRLLFRKRERNGIFFLLVFIFSGYFMVYITRGFREGPFVRTFTNISSDTILISETIPSKKNRAYQFNPNFISDEKGYELGISVEALDRFFQFREKGLFVNSPEEFQRITGITDSLLAALRPVFRFPVRSRPVSFQNLNYRNLAKKEKADLNTVDTTMLSSVYGVGSRLANRIVKYRTFLGGFSDDSQLTEVYGLKEEVVQRLLEKFTVRSLPEIKKININIATLRQLKGIPYLNAQSAKMILKYRSQTGEIRDIDELTKIQGFPAEKIKRIKVYLTVN